MRTLLPRRHRPADAVRRWYGARCTKGLMALVALMAILVTNCLMPAFVYAAPSPVDLELGGAGSVPWNIANIKPGDHGTNMLTVRNAGSAQGVLYIWVSDIVDILAPDRPGVPVDPGESWKLSDHLLLEPVSNRLSSTMTLPAVLAVYPTAPKTAFRITISPLGPGETIDLIWQWHLPLSVGNAIQANSLTFTLNYLLEEITVAPPPGGGESPVITTTPPTTPTSDSDTTFYFIITTPEKQTSMEVAGDGTIAESRTVDDISEHIIISFERNTQIQTVDNTVPRELRISYRTEIPDPPPGHVIVGPVYELLFFTDDGPRGVTLSQPARIVLNYLMETVPDYVRTLFIASYDEVNGWTQLQPVTGLITGEGQLGALANHFTLFTILGKIETDEPSVIKPPLPARFEMNSLSLSVNQVKSGESATARVRIINTGEMSGEYLLTLTINGLFMESQLIRLEPGQDRNVSFVFSPFVPGEYEIDVNGLRDILIVVEGPLSGLDFPLLRYWPMPAVPILVGAGFIIVGIALFFVFSQKHN